MADGALGAVVVLLVVEVPRLVPAQILRRLMAEQVVPALPRKAVILNLVVFHALGLVVKPVYLAQTLVGKQIAEHKPEPAIPVMAPGVVGVLARPQRRSTVPVRLRRLI